MYFQGRCTYVVNVYATPLFLLVACYLKSTLIVSESNLLEPFSHYKRNHPNVPTSTLQVVPSMGEHATHAKRRKTGNPYQARENGQPMPSAGKQAAHAKRGKTGNPYQAQENRQPMPSAGKRATGPCQAWSNHATPAKRGITCNPCQARENTRVLGCKWLWYCSDWVKDAFALIGLCTSQECFMH